MNTTTTQEISQLINNTRGRFFKVSFVKRSTGELRTMIARTGVSKGVTGVGLAFEPKDKNLRVVRDVQKKAFRMIPLDSVQSFQSGGVQWHA